MHETLKTLKKEIYLKYIQRFRPGSTKTQSIFITKTNTLPPVIVTVTMNSEKMESIYMLVHAAR
jgi:hypothetical protein